MLDSEIRYKAFISYRHMENDRRWARWLIEKLETYRTPAALIRQGIPTRIGRLFRDDDEIPASSDLSNQIEVALRNSEYLIVVCSRETPKSQWVRREIAFFQSLGKGNHVLALLVDGEPRDAFPPELLPKLEENMSEVEPIQTLGVAEPIAADVRPRDDEPQRTTNRRAVLRVAAGLLGVGYDDLEQRDRRRRHLQQQLLGAAALAGLVATYVIGSFAITHYSKRAVAQETAKFEGILEERAVTEKKNNMSGRATSFREFIDAHLKRALKELGNEDTQPDYRIVMTDDINGDGIADFVIYNQTSGFCGSGGCSYELYVSKGDGFESVQFPELFGKSSVFSRESRGKWKDIFTTDGGVGTYTVFNRNVYDESTNSYVEKQAWFCGGTDFETCSEPLILCPLPATANLELADGAKVYRAPCDAKTHTVTSSLVDSCSPISPPSEFNWPQAVSQDGKWVMLHYKFSGILYAQRADMSGQIGNTSCQ